MSETASTCAADGIAAGTSTWPHPEPGMAYGPHRITNTGEDIEHTAGDGGKYGVRAFECGRCHKRAVLADFAHDRVTCTDEAEAGWSRERADGLLDDLTFKGATAYAFTSPDGHGQPRTDTFDRPTAREVLALWLRAGGTFNWYTRELRVTCFGAAHSVKPSAEEPPATHGRTRAGEHVAVGELGPGDTFVTRCAFTVLAIADGTFTALGYDGQTITQTVPEDTRVRRIHRAPRPETGFQLPVPDGSSNGYAAFHASVFADPRITEIDIEACYACEYSKDGGRTWSKDTYSYPEVCGGHVQAEDASALLSGCLVIAGGPVRIIRGSYGTLTRWTLAEEPHEAEERPVEAREVDGSE
ncbi:hypothetical protein [Streptomyces sp. S1D4-20]|uniref:hypothetical protein n=1 Tax=Streptomyces sp. S1D4-20 TaxID=2594462 RepID=UPI001161DD86|nr:hypothetical protein [Streptomyces sp. S1D4-20]QDN54287.1 hypothetical protein FNV67_01630 [Streptomyces sp. S1D4-20]